VAWKDALVSLEPTDGWGGGVDGEDLAGVLGVDEVLDDRVPDGPRLARRSNDGDALGVEYGFHGHGGWLDAAAAAAANPRASPQQRKKEASCPL